MFRQDLLQALRLLRHKPVFAAAIVITLALGVGVNTALFSIVNALLLRPLPVADPAGMVVLGQRRAEVADYSNFSYPDFVDLQAQTTGVLKLAGYQLSLVGLTAAGRPERAMIHYVTGSFFSALGLRPALGRLIAPTEGQHLGADPIVVLSHSYWRRRFNADPSIVGASVSINARALTVVGVAPPEFKGPFALIEPDAYLPLSMAIIRPVLRGDPGEFWTRRDTRNLRLLGQLEPGTSLEQAQAAVSLAAERLAHEHPDTNKGLVMRVFPELKARPQPADSNPLPVVGAFFLLLAATVLLVACVNVANILLVRALGRQRELALRTSLGASRARLIRQSVTESMVLALLGGALGVVLGQQACAALKSLQLDLPVHLDFALDWRVFAYSFAASLATGIFVGVVPALRASRADVSAALREDGRSGTPGAWQRRLQNLLVAGQVAGSLVLLIVAGLLLRSLQQAQSMDLGFDPDRLINLSMDTHLIGFDQARGRAFYDSLAKAVRVLPGVESASLSHTVPYGYVHIEAEVYPEGAPASEPGERKPSIQYNVVDPGYFDNLRIALVRGRGFLEHDAQDAPRVAVVNETMARRFWPNEEAVGKRFAIAEASSPMIEVVGVARDGKYIEPGEDPTAYFFLPLAQHYTSYRTLQVRTSVPPGRMIPQVEEQIRTLAPDMPTWDVGTMKTALNGINGLFIFRVGAAMAAALGLLGLVLAMVGIYGVVAYTVNRRVKEIGLRMALGAQQGQILGLILRQGLVSVVLGVAAGLLLAAAVGRVVGSLLLGVGPYDPLTLGSVTVLLVVVAIGANLIPARRALKVDPMTALRAE